MRLAITCCCFLLIQFVRAQDSKFSFGLTVSPELSYRTLTIDSNSQSAQNIKDARDKSESSQLFFRTGIRANFNLGKSWRISSGISFQKLGYSRDVEEFVTSNQIDPQTGFVNNTSEPSLGIPSKITYHWNYLSIPVMISYVQPKEKLRFSAGLGVMNQFLISAVDKAHYKGKPNNRKVHGQNTYGFDYSKFNISAIAQLGIEFQFSERFYLSAKPGFQYQLFKGITGNLLSFYLYSTSLEFGLIYQR